ncbi:hypothetical protein BD626DRAFT_473800 [Schizophyllum amplum]|uniref:MARVEL domain-containing protein n=1 Tax=Schizophyllum amplum TaxID=97359 RepID=A0A550CX68_9AGAR|nr:hypothetical protein BD626DRAFT_473800 [Auriculariopsis ampla]
MAYPDTTTNNVGYSGATASYDHSPLRKGLYTLLLLLSLTLFGLTVTRIVLTESIYPRGYYDRVIAELLATTILTVPWTLYALNSLRRRVDRGFGRSFSHELITLAILWILWLVGAAVATAHWTDLYSCWYLSSCRILTAITAIAWSGFGVITALLIASAVLGRMKGGFGRPMHAQYSTHGAPYEGARTTNTAKHAEAGEPHVRAQV